MSIYLDIVFIENVIMNYIILLATVIITKEKLNQIRIIISSIIGGIYAVSYYVTKFSAYITISAKVILSIVMIYIAINPKSIKKMMKELIIFYLTSFAFGGCAIAVLYTIKPQNIINKKGSLIGIYPIKVALIGGIIGFITIIIAFKLVKNKMSIKDLFCTVKIIDNGTKKKVKALLDTGNFLKDPITNLPVIIVEKEKLIDILPREILENTNKIISGEFEIKDKYISKLRVLPFSSLGKQNGMLLGFKVEKVIVILNEEEVIRNDVIIGIYDKKLSINEKYECLIGMNYLENK